MFSITYRDTDEKVKERGKVLIESNNQLDRIYTIIGDNVSDNVSDNVKEHLVTIIKTLYMQPKQNRIDLIAQTKIKNPTLDRYIKILKNANIIEFVGPDKTGGVLFDRNNKRKTCSMKIFEIHNDEIKIPSWVLKLHAICSYF